MNAMVLDRVFDIDIFSESDEEDVRKPYIIRNKPSHFEIWDDFDFFARFRLKKQTVLLLLARIENQLLIIWNHNRALSPIQQLLLTLRFYATGSFLRAVDDFSGVCISTASRIVKKVSMAIASLRPATIIMPRNRVEIQATQQGFYRMHRFPRVIACVDGTHIRIQSPELFIILSGENAEVFRNRKGYFSINVQVVCNHELKATDIVARWPGSVHDATIFAHSNLHNRMELNQFDSGVLLGDSGYPLRNYLLTPVRNPRTPSEECYNDKHIRTRNIIERFFGVWKRRFPVLSIGVRVKLETVQDIIVATAVLHNWARDQQEEEPPLLEHNEDYGFDINVNHGPNEPEQLRDNATRQALIDDYFSRLHH